MSFRFILTCIALVALTPVSEAGVGVLHRAVARYVFLHTESGSRLLIQATGATAADEQALWRLYEYVSTRPALQRNLQESLTRIEEGLESHRAARGRSRAWRDGDALLIDEMGYLRDASRSLEGESILRLLDRREQFGSTARSGNFRQRLLEARPRHPRVIFDERLRGHRGTPELSEFSISAGELEIRGVRYGKPGGIPVLAGHGFAENSRLWRDLGRKLSTLGETGYDFWMVNWRGHGKGAHRSFLKSYGEGDYGFRAMAEEDLPAVLRHIHETTGQRVLVVGHSMGGMVSRAATAEHVFARVEMGSPRNFDGAPGLLRFMAPFIQPTTDWLKLDLPFPVLNRAPTAPDIRGVTGACLGALRAVVRQAACVLPTSILNRGNLTPDEITTLWEKVLSPVHTDIVHDFAEGIRHSARSGKNSASFTLMEDPRIPTLIVGGEFDALVPRARLFESVRANPPAEAFWSAEMMGMGHVDLVFGENATSKLAPLIHRFAKDPHSLGASGTHIEIPAL